MSNRVKGVLLIFTQERSATKFRRNTEEFYNSLYAQNMEYRHQYDEFIKHWRRKAKTCWRYPKRSTVACDVNIASYYTDKYALRLDFRTIGDNKLHGSGRRLENTLEGIRLQITKKLNQQVNYLVICIYSRTLKLIY